MTAMPTQSYDIDDILDQLASLDQPPAGNDLRGWLARYPEHAKEIVDFVTAWVGLEADPALPSFTEEESRNVVNRTMSRVQQILDKAEGEVEILDLNLEIKSAGFTLDTFEDALCIDRSMLTCLAERAIKPATIPLKLVREVSRLLNRGVDQVRLFLRRPPEADAAYKARQRPAPVQKDFSYIVQYAQLSDDLRAEWLAEPPDVALGD